MDVRDRENSERLVVTPVEWPWADPAWSASVALVLNPVCRQENAPRICNRRGEHKGKPRSRAYCLTCVKLNAPGTVFENNVFPDIEFIVPELRLKPVPFCTIMLSPMLIVELRLA